MLSEPLPQSEKLKALIYCRVSGKKQIKNGTGLDSQEYRCRQYAEAKGYEVCAVFPDDVSAGGDFMNRKGMVTLLDYMDRHAGTRFIVIFDDLKRYSRDTEFHLKLRRLMQERGATRECLNFNFEDSPEGKFNETIVAAAGTYERETLGRQNRQKAMARAEQGYCIRSVPPVGLKYEKTRERGKVLVRDEPVASIVQEAMEGYATGRFRSQAEVTRFLNGQPHFPKKSRNGTVSQQRAVDLLRQCLYAGYIHMPTWGISMRDAQHEGLISKETFKIIQDKLDGRVYAPARKDIAEDFPLRGAVACSACGTPLTAGWCKGKYQKFAYYFCRKKGCDRKGKTIAKAKLEGEFEAVLKSMKPTPHLFNVAYHMFRDAWEMRLSQTKEAAKAFTRQAADIEKQIDEIVDRMVQITNPRALTAFEDRLEKLEQERLIVLEKAANSGGPKRSFRELFELSMQFLANPWKIWALDKMEYRTTVLRLAFLGPLRYDRKTGCLNTEKSLPFKVLDHFSMLSERMVLPGRFELPASPLPRECSTPELRQHT